MRIRVCSLPLLCVLVCASVVNPISGHPVPSFAYDRVVQVKLTPAGIDVDYQLSVNEITIFRDLVQIVDDKERAALVGDSDSQDAFVKALAPLLADRLEAAQNDRPLTFECVERSWVVEDHVRCKFIFRARWPTPPEPGQRFRFDETNYEKQTGQIDLGFADGQA